MTWMGKATGVPSRMQKSRRKGANLQADSIALNELAAVSCSRPGKHGNPYYPGCGRGFGGFDDAMRPVHWSLETNADMVRHYREYTRLMKRDQPDDFAAYVSPLRGRNLACYCKLCAAHADGKPLGITCDDCAPCHVDVLLELANG